MKSMIFSILKGGASEQLCWLMSKIISELETPGIYFEFPEKEAIQVSDSKLGPHSTVIGSVYRTTCFQF